MARFWILQGTVGDPCAIANPSPRKILMLQPRHLEPLSLFKNFKLMQSKFEDGA